MIIKKVKIKKVIKADREDSLFWKDVGPHDRLNAVEMYRRDYWGEKYADESGFPRIFKIVKHL